MGQGDNSSRRAEEKLRREASVWFARMRGLQAPAHQDSFDRWRGAHPDHQIVYDRLLRRWEDAAVLGMSQQATGSVPSGVRRHFGDSSGLRWLFAPLMAGGLAAATLVLSPVRPDWVELWPIPSAWSQRVATEVGQIRRVPISDGSSVTLDTNTIVVTRISRSARRLTLVRGRARFDVAHDPSRPFVVAAGDAFVAARGTLFDVSLNPGRKVAVTLIRGIVDVQGPVESTLLHAGLRTRARLVAGQQIAFGKGSPAPTIQPATPGGGLWPEGLLTFQATPLSEVVAEANRYSRDRIQLASPAVGALQVSGVFRATAPRAIADSLAAAFDLRVKDEPDGDLMLIGPSPPPANPSGQQAAWAEIRSSRLTTWRARLGNHPIAQTIF